MQGSDQPDFTLIVMRLKEAQVFHKSKSETAKAANSGGKHGGGGSKAKDRAKGKGDNQPPKCKHYGKPHRGFCIILVLHRKVKLNSRDEQKNWKNGTKVRAVKTKLRALERLKWDQWSTMRENQPG